MDLWFVEHQVPGLTIGLQLRESLRRERTPYQDLLVVDSLVYGRTLILDGAIQTTEKDEFTYHEMIAHVPLFTHPHPRRVLIVGGGDGGALREVLRHEEVREAVLAEIDERVVAASRDFFPTLSSAMDDPRARIQIGDGVEHVRQSTNQYDVIIVDSTDPVGPAEGLFTPEFYAACHRALTADGVLVVQSESPFVSGDLVRRCYLGVSRAFPRTWVYLAVVPTYPSGLWSFVMGSKGPDALSPRPCSLKTRYYTTAVHRAAFVLPPFVEELLSPEAVEEGSHA